MEHDEVEYRVVREDGSWRWVRDRAFPVMDASGKVYRIAGVSEDITDRKWAEFLLEAQRDLGTTLSSTSNLQAGLDRLLNVAIRVPGMDCGGAPVGA
jgi:hypothetical protein